MILLNEIGKAIDKLGVANEEICIHSSMKSFGDKIEDGIKGLVDVFLSKNCTIMVPTFSYIYCQNAIEKYMPKRNGINYDLVYSPNCDKNAIFNPNSKDITAESMGILPKYILGESDSRRGNHPINSFTAIGAHARRLIETQTPQKVYAPFEQLMFDDGYVLLMGVGLDRATIIHYAEQLSGRKLFIRWANDSNGNVIPIPGGGCSKGFNNFENILKPYKEAVVGNSLWRCYKAKDIVQLCKNAIEENAQITHCDDVECLSCNDAVLGGPIIDF